MSAPALGEEIGVRRTRERRRRLVGDNKERQDIAERVCRFYREDVDKRQGQVEKLLQLHAKLRMWTDGSGDFPWADSSDAAIPDIAQDSLRTQDTLHNAVMSGRPAVKARAINPSNAEKQEAIDNLLDYQMFVEQDGENEIGKLAESFVNDGHFTAFIPWIREEKPAIDVRTFDGIPDEMLPVDYFDVLLDKTFSGEVRRQTTDEGWDWIVSEGEEKEKRIAFYTRRDEVLMEVRETILVYEGPRVLHKDFQDVLHPERCENLQAPGPSNPNGATHVILVDFPTLDEVKRLQRQGRYDMVTMEKLNELEDATPSKEEQRLREQQDTFQGQVELMPPKDPGHRTFTRLTCFDTHDVNGDGLQEDVVWFVLKEPKLLLKSATLTELYPGRPPRRPFGEGTFMPAAGHRWGQGLPEILEGLHDLTKQVVDQLIDGNTMQITPFGFYRAASNINPEVMRMWPGDLAPLNDPKNDVFFPNLQIGGQAFALNLIQILGQWSDGLSLVGDLQLGRVPFGKSSALRTESNMNAVLGQGEARPERILRRFFSGLKQIYQEMYQRNRFFMKKPKQIRVIGVNRPGKDPFMEVTPSDFDGVFEFEFTANVLNSSKQALQAALMETMRVTINPLMLQLGITTPEKIHRTIFDYVASLGPNPENHMQPPSPQVMGPQVTWHEAVDTIMQDEMPDGRPAEGAMAHLDALLKFFESDDFGFLTNPQSMLFRQWMETVTQMAAAEQQAAQQFAAAEQFQQETGRAAGGGKPGPAAQQIVGAGGPTQLGDNELLDETLIGAGGGAAG